MPFPELAVVIPFVNEYPLICTTIREIVEELRGHVSFEILAVDNWCEQVEAQGREPDRGHTLVESMSKGIPELKVLRYPDRLSHWQAKRFAIEQTSAPFLFFCDAHVMVRRNALRNMFDYYSLHAEELDGTLHLPLTYHILEEKRLIYSLRWLPEKAEVHYFFSEAKKDVDAWYNNPSYEVPCMSTCGMMMTRKLYYEMGGWSEELGIYGGGENLMNFVLSVLGKKKWIFYDGLMYHHGEKRGYDFNLWDYERNRIIATYLFGGEELAARFVEGREGLPSKRQIYNTFRDVLDKCAKHRAWIKERQVTTIEKWVEDWL
jgi:hypothetical protein